MPTKTILDGDKSERVKLAECLHNFTKRQEEFMNSIDTLKEYKATVFKDLDIQIEAKKKELEELTKTYKNTEIDLKIKCDQDIKLYKNELITEVLNESNEVSINKNEYDKITNELKTLKSEIDSRITTLNDEHKKDKMETIHACIKQNDLKHTAETAEIKALAKQRENENLVLTKTIDNLKIEVAEQRKLTAQVAESTKQGAINQTIGK